jgi:hypothetical protein
MPVFVVVGDLEDLGVLNSTVEVSDEASDGIVHFVALLLTLKLQVDNNSWLVYLERKTFMLANDVCFLRKYTN